MLIPAHLIYIENLLLHCVHFMSNILLKQYHSSLSYRESCNNITCKTYCNDICKVYLRLINIARFKKSTYSIAYFTIGLPKTFSI